MSGLSLDQLKNAFRGELIQPMDAVYDAARKVYNGMVDKRPALIARCANVADVMAAVNYGRENGLLTAIRGVATAAQAWELVTEGWSSI